MIKLLQFDENDRDWCIQLYQRPSGLVVDEIVALAKALVSDWFTPNVPGDARRDLAFHDVLCLYHRERLVSFLMFTSIDGALNITLMGTDPAERGHGAGSRLMTHFFEHAKGLGYDQIIAMTVPPDVKPVYAPTVRFYEKHGFVLNRRYDELWESGAIELIKNLKD